jgi:hypothetical protein
MNMGEMDQDIQELLRACPILSDADFQRKYPGIVDVVAFLDQAAKTHYRETGEYEPFDKLGINNAKDYVALVREGNPEAVKIYEKIQGVLQFK